MKSVPVPQDKFASLGFGFSQPEGSPIAAISYPRPDEKAPLRTVNVVCDGTTLRFFPERSAAHAILLKDLGFSIP